MKMSLCGFRQWGSFHILEKGDFIARCSYVALRNHFSVKTRSSVELLVACDIMIDGYQFLGSYLCSVTAFIWRFASKHICWSREGKTFSNPALWLNTHYSLQTKTILCLQAFSQVAPLSLDWRHCGVIDFPLKADESPPDGEPASPAPAPSCYSSPRTLGRTALHNRSLSVPAAKRRTLIRIMPSRSLLSLLLSQAFPTLKQPRGWLLLRANITRPECF